MSQRRRRKVEKRARKQQAKRRRQASPSLPFDDLEGHRLFALELLRELRAQPLAGRAVWLLLGGSLLAWDEGVALQELFGHGRTEEQQLRQLDWTRRALAWAAEAAVSPTDPRREDARWALEQASTSPAELGLEEGQAWSPEVEWQVRRRLVDVVVRVSLRDEALPAS